ncbi:hypothetical protein ACHAPY_011408 [Fusarium culmorum]
MNRGVSGSPHWAQPDRQPANNGFFDSWNSSFDLSNTAVPLHNSSTYSEPNVFNTPPLTHSGVPSLSLGTPGAGSPQPCTLNLVLRPEQVENNNQNSEFQSQIIRRLDRMEHGLDRVGSLMGELKACLANLEDRMEAQRSLHEEEVRNSIETIKKGMDKFFTCFASQLENEMADVDERDRCKAEVAVM